MFIKANKQTNAECHLAEQLLLPEKLNNSQDIKNHLLAYMLLVRFSRKLIIRQDLAFIGQPILVSIFIEHTNSGHLFFNQSVMMV